MKKIIVIIDPDGNPVVKTEGYTGRECKDASRWLEQALGTPVAETLTPEFHQPLPTTDRLKQGS